MKGDLGFLVTITGFVIGKMDLLLPTLEAMSFAVSILTGVMSIVNHVRKKKRNKEDQ